MGPEQLLTTAHSIVVVDWPSRDVPDTLARCGYATLVKGGPAPDNYTAYEVRDGAVATRPTGRPAHADLVYSHRPLAELAEIVALAKQLGATGIWAQSGRASEGIADPKGCWVPDAASEKARATVESAGLFYIDHLYIADVARKVRG